MSTDKQKQSLREFTAAYEPPPEDYEQHQQDRADIAEAEAHFARLQAPILADLRAVQVAFRAVDYG